LRNISKNFLNEFQKFQKFLKRENYQTDFIITQTCPWFKTGEKTTFQQQSQTIKQSK
jgi:hypothetical protein